MKAKVISLDEYRLKKMGESKVSPETQRYFDKWLLDAREWEIYYDKHKHMCTSCDFWGLEQGTNKLGCTHKYRQFIEGCPLWRKP